jgi:hypothetical protein
LLGALDREAGRLLDAPGRLLREDSLARRAGAGAHLAQFDAGQALRVLLGDCRHHAGLTLVGSIATRFDILRLLRGLVALGEREAREPALLDMPVERPIFITGLPRSGSTFLHKLLTEDPENRSPAVWETIFPLPRGPHDPPARRIAAVDRQLAAFERLSPGFRAVHPIDALSPQECTEITAHVFRSFRFETMHDVPRYRAWLREADHAPAYRFHRAFLQHLQYGDGRPRRWVLKAPDHVFTLRALAAVYPDARIVFLHRDPLDVLASVAGLTTVLRRPFTACADPRAIGRQVAADWQEGATAMLRAEAERLFPADHVLHLRFSDLVADPMGSVAILYGRFGLALDAAVRQRMERRIAGTPHGGYGGVTYALAPYGIDPAATRRHFAAYMERFAVPAGRIDRA